MHEHRIRIGVKIAALLLLATASLGARADVLVGPKGERLPGKLVERRDGLIIFQSDFLGRIEVRADLAHVETVAHASGATTSAPAPLPLPLPLPFQPGNWSADLGVKLNLDRGSLKSREDRVDAGLKIVRPGLRGEFHSVFDYKYQRTDGELKHDDWGASLAYDRFVSNGRFVAGRVSALSELAEDGTNQTNTVALAYGWRLFETPHRYLRIGPALGYVVLKRGDSGISGPAVGLYARGRGPYIWRTTYEYEVQALDTLSDGRYATLDLRWRKPLGEHLYLALVWQYTWSDVEIESGFSSEWRWDIGWRFGPVDSQ